MLKNVWQLHRELKFFAVTPEVPSADLRRIAALDLMRNQVAEGRRNCKVESFVSLQEFVSYPTAEKGFLGFHGPFVRFEAVLHVR